MLNKPTCVQCIERFYNMTWSVFEEDDWVNREVCSCPAEIDDSRSPSIHDNPPETCPHKFEHAIGETLCTQ